MVLCSTSILTTRDTIITISIRSVFLFACCRSSIRIWPYMGVGWEGSGRIRLPVEFNHEESE
jgi:hypothetical protein